MKYDLIVVTIEPFPNGLAATNRMLSYLKGIAISKRVLFLTYAGPKYFSSECNFPQRGEFGNIEYRYIGAPTLPYKPNGAYRLVALVWRYIKLYLLLIFRYQSSSVLVYSREVPLIRALKFISKIKHYALFRDVTETNATTATKVAEEKLKQVCRRLDGLIVISQGIRDFFNNIPAEKKFLLPVLVDSSRFNNTEIEKEKYFFCCSGANLERDGLLDSMKGVLTFHQEHPEYVLQIASSLNMEDPYHVQCKKMMDEHPDVFLYLGKLPATEIPQKMMKASALLLTPHQNYKTKGFPTKLGEYLMSGTPTICSTIDDLQEIIQTNAVFAVHPNSPNEISQALIEIVEQPSKAAEIGQNGKKLMIEFRTIESYISDLLAFLQIK